jgi:mannose/fructose/N-acetylgalactosamine-specific phosphotransferase system component IIC
MGIFDNDEENKNFLSKMALTLLAISIIGCILAIIDYHADLHTSWSNEKSWTLFLYGFNVIVIIGNLSYIGFAIHRSNKFSSKNKFF